VPKKALIYAYAVVAAGFAVLLCAALSWSSSNTSGFLGCLSLAAVAATFKFKFPRLTGTLSPAFVFVLLAAATLSWQGTVCIAAASGVVQSLWRPKTRPQYLQVAFSAATMALAAGLSHAAFEAQALIIPVLALALAGVTLFTANTLIVSTVLCLLREAPFSAIWKGLQLWSVPYYVAGSLLAALWASIGLHAWVGRIVLAALSAWLLSLCYRRIHPRLDTLAPASNS
jgi:hypothetical protein